jgi:hypothetical protein
VLFLFTRLPYVRRIPAPLHRLRHWGSEKFSCFLVTGTVTVAVCLLQITWCVPLYAITNINACFFMCCIILLCSLAFYMYPFINYLIRNSSQLALLFIHVHNAYSPEIPATMVMGVILNVHFLKLKKLFLGCLCRGKSFWHHCLQFYC